MLFNSLKYLNRSAIFLRCIQNSTNQIRNPPASIASIRHLCNKVDQKSTKKSEDTQEPVKFFGSAASLYQAKQSRTGSQDLDEVPWFQTYVVVGSVAIFLIYFCILREENDMDIELEKSLFERIPGLERQQLVVNYRFNLENNKDNTDIVKRMKELGMDTKDYD